MASALTNWFGNQILTVNFVKFGAWVGLHTDEPNITGSPLYEVVGGGYIRQKATFGSPAAKTISANSKLIFASMPVVTLKFVSFNDAEVDGNMYSYVEISPIAIAADSHFVIPAYDLALTI